MRILALDTSTSLASVAIISADTILTESAFSCNRSLSARLVPEIGHQLELAGLSVHEINLFAASTGPGSFTGVRCGVATIQGLALAAQKPCAGFSSLAALAMNCPLSPYPVCALLDARKNEVYAGLYDCGDSMPKVLIRDCVMPMDQFLVLVRQQNNSKVIFVGEGAQRYHDLIAEALRDVALFAPLSGAVGRASHGALLAREAHRTSSLLSPGQLLPDYIRPSEAELARRTKV